jgi:hypothetical protein
MAAPNCYIVAESTSLFLEFLKFGTRDGCAQIDIHRVINNMNR